MAGGAKGMAGSKGARLSKSRIIAHRQCPKRLWLQTFRSELAEDSDQALARMEEGNRVGEVARTLHPGGLLIDGENLQKACRDTERALKDATRPVFEATLNHQGVLVRADLLLPGEGAWRLVEVKSSTSVKDYHYADAAIQTWVMSGAGVPIQQTSIAHIDSSFIYPGGGDYRGLLKQVDVTGEVRALWDEVPQWIEAARETVAGAEPAIEPGEQCEVPYTCPFFAHCNPDNADESESYPVELLRRGWRLAAQLRAEGYDDLRNVPESRLNHPVHLRTQRVAKSGQPELDPDVRKVFKGVPYPRYYLDFETIQFALPIWAGTKPYEQLPMQWSLHVEFQSGEIEHHSFLPEGGEDPQRAFAESLVAAVGKEGVIYAYNAGFERSRILELAGKFEDLAAPLKAIAGRFVDLLPVAVDHYYHPAMQGSWSLKAVLPTIAPHLSHDTLDISDGGMASQGLLELIDPQVDPARKAILRKHLLEYCGRDTLALVVLVRFFEGKSVDSLNVKVADNQKDSS